MERDSHVEIQFFVGQEAWARRLWAQVPRVGDEVMLGAGRNNEYPADAHGKAAFRVVRVVWGTEGPDDKPWAPQCVNV